MALQLVISKPSIFIQWGFGHLYYRTIEIYNQLSMIFMHYTDNIKNDYFYGLTYLKKGAFLFGVDPSALNTNTITAKLYQGYGYAMPGPIGDGYGNFGYFCIFIVPLITFPIIYYFEYKYFKFKTLKSGYLYLLGIGGLIFNASSIIHYLSFLFLGFLILSITTTFKFIFKSRKIIYTD
tara:strand:- start:524 stop:1060 length:537 start_codon:yes stop_codon:yes gene_type:complete